MCQYSSILQAISNIPQYSSIFHEQLGDMTEEASTPPVSPGSSSSKSLLKIPVTVIQRVQNEMFQVTFII